MNKWLKKDMKALKGYFNKLVKPIRKKIRKLSNTYNVKKEVFKNSHLLFTLHPFLGFKVKNIDGIKELTLGFASWTLWSFHSEPRIHGFKLDSFFILTSKNLRKIPTAFTLDITINPLWYTWHIYNYRTVKNLQNPMLQLSMHNLMVESAVNDMKGDTLKRKEKALSRKRTLTKFEKEYFGINKNKKGKKK